MNGIHSEVVELEGGGDLTVTRFPDGVIRFAHEKDGTRLSFGLTAIDLRKVRLAAGEIILTDHVDRIGR